MTTWILRFCQNIRVNSYKLIMELSYEEIQKAKETDTNNPIRMIRSRIIHGQDPEDFVRSTVLPDHPIVRRLIDYAHKTRHHAGVQTTLFHLREQFWISQIRRVVREVLQKYVTCSRYTSKPVVTVVPAPLPVDRINQLAAFEVTGAALAGPIYLKLGEKAWIVIFTCAVYRAIQLELLTSPSTEAFMQAMRRFFARRERSCIMYTDNKTTSLGTSRALCTLNWHEFKL
ncbi:hypothetical protein AVEN_6745-1 [Araneus ventricosus]|uniref:Integrase zinc-binding domain-containing protein n=1 Tax=Araneus ventricosus TaxID=182803 RepID=A0A4Y2REV7_ARAVE|nr:hypothetical protein AVEN_6745-1 [Araneus ventricosus]